MKKEFKFTWPPQAIFVGIAVGVVYGWKVGLLAFLAIGLVYTLGGGK